MDAERILWCCEGRVVIMTEQELNIIPVWGQNMAKTRYISNFETVYTYQKNATILVSMKHGWHVLCV
jgi:hypothetical protein